MSAEIHPCLRSHTHLRTSCHSFVPSFLEARLISSVHITTSSGAAASRANGSHSRRTDVHGQRAMGGHKIDRLTSVLDGIPCRIADMQGVKDLRQLHGRTCIYDCPSVSARKMVTQYISLSGKVRFLLFQTEFELKCRPSRRPAQGNIFVEIPHSTLLSQHSIHLEVYCYSRSRRERAILYRAI